MNAISTFCPICKQKNIAGVEECAFCGTPLPKPGTTTAHMGGAGQQLPLVQQPKPQPVTVPTGAIGLSVMGNEALIIPFNSKTAIILGRLIGSEIMQNFADLTPYHAGPFGVSRQHAKINTTQTGYTIEDLQSTNGTWLNRSALMPQKPYPLSNGDEIRLGKLWLIFHCPTD